MVNPAKVVIHEMKGMAWDKFSTFLEKALVSLVNRLMFILIVKF